MNATRRTGIYGRYGRHILYGALPAVVMAAISASQVQADVDGKLYPASMCVRWAGAEPLLEHSRLFNTGSTTLRLDCPVVRDILSGFLESIKDAYVDVINNHATQQVCAELLAISQVESATFTVESSGRQCTPLSGFTSQRLSFGILGGYRDTEHYYFSVSIPPVDAGRRSGIISYEVDEED